MYFGMLSLGCHVSVFQGPAHNLYDSFMKDAAHYQMLSNEALVLAGNNNLFCVPT
jgi:hypothetical protein